MKKIGLFTYYKSNYGASLQAYALKAFIEQSYQNVNVKIIDFYITRDYPIFTYCSSNPIKRVVKNMLVLRHYFDIRRRNSRHISFNREALELCRYDIVCNSLLEQIPVYDLYLTGSDQVFNIKNNDYKKLFFQQFDIKFGIKAAYAPSFGQSIFSQEEKDIIKELTKNFDFLSCRENDGATMLSEVHGREVPCVIDPTLLLNSEQWSKVMKVPETKNQYLLVYDLNGGVPMLNIAREFAAEKGLKIYCITRHPDISFIYKGIDKVIYDAGPREFVGYFSRASYVVTDSFHGTAFAIIFKKNFNTYIALPRASQRIKSLLGVCNLLGRIVDKDGPINTTENCFSIFDWESFENYRQLSIKYISSFIARI